MLIFESLLKSAFTNYEYWQVDWGQIETQTNKQTNQSQI